VQETVDNTPSGIVIKQKDLRIITPFFDIRLSQDGGIEYIKDPRDDRFISKQGSFASFFEGTIGGKKIQSSGRWVIQQLSESAPFVTAREYGFIADIPYQFEIKIHEDNPVIECYVQFDFNGQKIGLLSDDLRDSHSPFIHEEKLRFKFFPEMSDDAAGIRDLPFVIAETADKYVEGNYWTAVSDGQYGLAFFNKGNMGSIRESDGSFSIPLAYSMYYIWGTRILNGTYSFEFAIYPFVGDWQTAGLHRKALEYNFPLPYMEEVPGNGRLGNQVDILNVEADNLVLSALYSSDSKIFARFYEYKGSAAIVKINTSKKTTGITEVDLDGNSKAEVFGRDIFSPHQIKTYMIK